MSSWICLAFLSHWIYPTLGFDVLYANLTAYTTGSGNVSPYDPFPLALESRQQRTCPAGFLPCSGQNYCCEPGTQCCGIPATRCCSTFCESLPLPCCPFSAQTCGGSACCIAGSSCCRASPVGCCPSGAVCCNDASNPCCPEGTACCGNTCCPSGEVCERNECIPEALKNNVARFHYDEKKNGNLLRNMCNGLRGKNTEVFTYSGPANTKALKSAKRKKRRAAGCKGGFCGKAINNGGNAALNSCDEFPPASSDEGGGTRAELQRVANCIEDVQNSLQGTIFSKVLSKLSKGDKFVISVDCDEVLGSINPREAVSESGGNTRYFNSSFFVNSSTGFLLVPFGDLLAGSYSANINVSSGSATGAFVVDNTGDNMTTLDAPLKTGDSQQFSFILDEEAGGVGLVLATNNAKTNVTWTFQGTTFDNVTDSDEDPSTEAPQGTSGPVGISSGASTTGGFGWAWVSFAAAAVMAVAIPLHY